MAGVLDHVRQGFLHDAIGRELDTGVDCARVALDVPAPKLDLAKMLAFKDQGVKGNVDGVAFLLKKNKIDAVHGTGRIAALHSGNWGLDRLEREAKDDQGKWKVQFFPRWRADGPKQVGNWGGSVLVIPRANRNHAAAIKWASFLSSNVEAQVGLWQNGYGLPTSLTAQRDPRMREPQPFLGQSMFEASVEGREVFYTHLVRDWPRVQIEMGRQLDAMFQGNKTPDQAWNDFEAAMVRQYG